MQPIVSGQIGMSIAKVSGAVVSRSGHDALIIVRHALLVNARLQAETDQPQTCGEGE
jgi:microcompartment protein CcmK/EutM